MSETRIQRFLDVMKPVVTEESIRFAVSYEPKKDDIFVVSYGKAGFHWTYGVIELIMNGGVYEEDIAYRFNRSRIESHGKDTLFRPAMCTHLTYDLLPKNSLAKYLYVFRNPKDTVVSAYHHLRRRYASEYTPDFHHFFHQWITGQRFDYFKVVSEYWRHRMDGKSDYVVYEQMKRNPKEGVLKIANFLGKEFVDKLLANNELLLNEVLNKTSFDYMKEKKLFRENVLRKGIVGDWRSHLTKNESDFIDAKFTEYFAGTELESIWREDMKWL